MKSQQKRNGALPYFLWNTFFGNCQQESQHSFFVTLAEPLGEIVPTLETESQPCGPRSNWQIFSSLASCLTYATHIVFQKQSLPSPYTGRLTTSENDMRIIINHHN